MNVDTVRYVYVRRKGAIYRVQVEIGAMTIARYLACKAARNKTKRARTFGAKAAAAEHKGVLPNGAFVVED